jgi:hypothetical protein
MFQSGEDQIIWTQSDHVSQEFCIHHDYFLWCGRKEIKGVAVLVENSTGDELWDEDRKMTGGGRRGLG